MAVPISYPPELQRLIDAVAEWYAEYVRCPSDEDASVMARQRLKHAFDAFRDARYEPVAEQPKSEEDTRRAIPVGLLDVERLAKCLVDARGGPSWYQRMVWAQQGDIASGEVLTAARQEAERLAAGLMQAFEAFRDTAPEPAAEQPKAEEDTRPKVVQLCVQGETDTEHAARQVLLEDGSLWERVFDKTSRGWERVEDLPAAARGGPR